jgi:hypothetical protein
MKWEHLYQGFRAHFGDGPGRFAVGVTSELAGQEVRFEAEMADGRVVVFYLDTAEAREFARLLQAMVLGVDNALAEIGGAGPPVS